MLENVEISRLNNTDLNMYQCGTQDCTPGHAYGPAVRDHFLIHYIRKGKGIFQVGGSTYELHEGQGFLICPGIVTFYQADMDDPWAYSWVGFHGLKAEQYLDKAGLSSENPIFEYNNDSFIEDCFREMVATKRLVNGREIRLIGLLYIFLSQLIEVRGRIRLDESPSNRKDDYIRKAIEFVEKNYSRKIQVSDIASYIGLDRSYLGSIFKESLNTTLQEFLMNYRMNKACELMKNNTLSIGDISRSVGYDDPLQFSKVFKKIKAQAPREYRKTHFQSCGI